MYRCVEKKMPKEYYVIYRIYYTNTDIKIEEFRASFPENKSYDLHFDSYRGTNFITINVHDSLGVAVRVLSTIAPTEIIDYSDNFKKAYGIDKLH